MSNLVDASGKAIVRMPIIKAPHNCNLPFRSIPEDFDIKKQSPTELLIASMSQSSDSDNLNLYLLTLLARDVYSGGREFYDFIKSSGLSIQVTNRGNENHQLKMSELLDDVVLPQPVLHSQPGQTEPAKEAEILPQP